MYSDIEEMQLSGDTQINAVHSNVNLYCRYYDPTSDFYARLPENLHQDYWTHLELGAGNYGDDGHTQKSQKMTVLRELKTVTSAPNYISALPENSTFVIDRNHQFQVLFDTLDTLVTQQGKQGIFHVNDLYSEYTQVATDALKSYAISKGYNSIFIESVPGDYRTIDSVLALASYERPFYDSVHLKNPEVSFYHYGMDGGYMLSDSESRQKARDTLQQLANLSYQGLFFFPINIDDYFIPLEEYIEFISEGIFYHNTSVWTAVGYNFPEGSRFSSKLGAVYFIEHNYSCS